MAWDLRGVGRTFVKGGACPPVRVEWFEGRDCLCLSVFLSRSLLASPKTGEERGRLRLAAAEPAVAVVKVEAVECRG